MRPHPYLISLAMAAAGTAVVARQAQTFRAGAPTVWLYATVTNKTTGRFVADLTAGDFEVDDDGHKQPIAVFSNDLQPITAVIMLDRSGSVEPHLARERSAASVFIANLLASDRARVGSFANDIRIEPPAFTSDQDALTRAVRGMLLEAGPTPLWRAALAGMDALAAEQGRRVLMLFTDGNDSPDLGAPQPDDPSLDDVRLRAGTDDVLVYTFGIVDPCAPTDEAGAGSDEFQRGGGRGGGRGGMPRGGRGRGGRGTGACVNSPSLPDPGLRTLAADVGGAYAELASDDEASVVLGDLADELHHQYLIAFTAPKLDGKVHTIEVKVRGSHLVARARPSYVAAPAKPS